MTNKEQRWVVTSTWGQHYVLAESEGEAEEKAQDELTRQGAPDEKILDGMTEEWSLEGFGEWEP